MAHNSAVTERLTQQHGETLEQALAAIRKRDYWSAYPESPSPRVYGEHAAADGEAAFRQRLGEPWGGQTPGAAGVVATERSPYGLELGVRYPRVASDGLDELLEAARRGMGDWRDAGPQTRVAVCQEVLARLHAQVFDLAHAVQHTSGQAFVMAFQAGGTHALDRALEALAYGFDQQTLHPATALWEKPGRGEPVRMDKTFTPVPRGVGLVVGCNTFPTWNSWPGLFASLVCGNAVVVKPHPRAVLPLAMTVEACREVLTEAGFDADLVTLAAEAEGDGLAAELAVRPEVRLVDFTGSNAFGTWLEQHATQAAVFTEKSGVNAVVIDSTADFAAMCDNLAFSLALYTGQMCTAPQDLFVPEDGINTDEGHKSYDEVAAGIGAALDRLLGDDKRAAELLGAVVSDAVLARLDASSPGATGRVLVESRVVDHPAWPGARVRTPLLLGLSVADAETYGEECFGPVAYLIATPSTGDSLAAFVRTSLSAGAMTAAVYSTSDGVLADALAAALDAGVALSENLTGAVFVNQSAAFSDFHGTGANPSATASYTDAAFVASRFRIVQSRRPA
ncbi:MAG: phenylacetic acid degradation protein PaaN [Actinomycetota bacterium]|nr:phenylacetic acid degradation protein PaaN [Actinomycetota bacterium]